MSTPTDIRANGDGLYAPEFLSRIPLPSKPRALITTAFDEMSRGERPSSSYFGGLISYLERLRRTAAYRLPHDALNRAAAAATGPEDAHALRLSCRSFLYELTDAFEHGLLHTLLRASEMYRLQKNADAAYASTAKAYELFLLACEKRGDADGPHASRPDYESFPGLPGAIQSGWEEIAAEVSPPPAVPPEVEPAPPVLLRRPDDAAYPSGLSFEKVREEFPAYRLQFLSETTRLLIEGDSGRARAMWMSLLTYHLRLQYESLGRLEGFVAGRDGAAAAGANGFGVNGHADKFIEHSVRSFVQGLRQTYLRLARLCCEIGRTDEARGVLNHMFSLHEIIYPDDAGQWLDAFFKLKHVDVYRRCVTADTQLGARVVEGLRALQGDSGWNAAAAEVVGAEEWDEDKSRAVCEAVVSAFRCELPQVRRQLPSHLESLLKSLQGPDCRHGARFFDALVARLIQSAPLTAEEKYSIYPRLAEGAGFRGFSAAAARLYEHLIVPDEALPDEKRWEYGKQLARGLQAAGRRLRYGPRHDESADYFARAEKHFLDAARIFEPELDLRESECDDIRNTALHGHLALLYYEWDRLAEAEAQVGFLLPWLRSNSAVGADLSLYSFISYIVALVLMDLERPAEAVGLLEKLIDLPMDKRFKVKALHLLRRIHIVTGDQPAIDGVKHKLLSLERRSPERDADDLTEEQESGLFSQHKMREYVFWCQKMLDMGHYRTLIQQLPKLIGMSRVVAASGKPDVVLLTLLASAYLQVGNHDESLRVIDEALRASGDTKNRGICWMMKGKILLHQGRPREAADAFERSYTGGGGHLGAILKASTAHSLAGDHSRALLCVEELVQSGADKSPYKTMTQKCWALWRRYCDPEPGVGGSDDDVREACDLLTEVIVGKYSHPGDRYAIGLLVKMAGHPVAKKCIVGLLKDSHFFVRKCLVETLTLEGVYDPDFTPLVARLLPEGSTAVPTKAASNPVSQFIMGAWVQHYFSQDRDAVREFVSRSVGLLFERCQALEFWAGLFAVRNTMTQHVRESVAREILAILERAPSKNPAATIDYLRNMARSTILDHLETKLVGLTKPAYQGREPGESLLEEAVRLVQCWILSSSLRDSVNPTISAKGPAAGFLVSPFQCGIMSTAYNQFVEHCGSLEALGGRVAGVSLRLEDRGETVGVKLIMSFGESVGVDELGELYKSVRETALVNRWTAATEPLLPEPFSVELDEGRNAVSARLSLWKTSVPDRGQWKWNRLYRHVVEPRYLAKSRDSYYEAARHCAKDALPLGRRDLEDYALLLLDGLFVRAYRKSLKRSLEAVPHNIKNILSHLPAADDASPLDLGPISKGVQKLYKDFLKVGRPSMREFDVRGLVDNILSDSEYFYPDISFEFWGRRANDVLIRGSSLHIGTALWDVVHNAVDAVRLLPPDEVRRVRVSLTQLMDGVEVVISNTGPNMPEGGRKGLGIGTQNVEYVVEDLHRGMFTHGPLHTPAGFNYAWRLFLPVTPE